MPEERSVDTNAQTQMSCEGEALIALVCAMQRESESCSEGEYKERVMNALEMCGVMSGEHAWNDERWSDTLNLMIDTGASTHMTNSRQAFIQDTLKTCGIQVMGIGGAPIYITEKGSVPLCVGGRQYVLSNVLLHQRSSRRRSCQ